MNRRKLLLYTSTRGTSPAVSLSEAITAGLAADGGLYVPEALPQVNPTDFDPNGSLADTANTLLTPFFVGDLLAEQLPAICAEAFNIAAPLRPLALSEAWVLELFHGPSAAFKDFGARFLAACLRRQQSSRAKPLTILVATSGDTGAAVAAAFHRQPGIEIVILYPDGLVSPRQAHQLGCFGDNTHALRVQGRFDDCQRMVKAALNDPYLQRQCPLSSANSISLGRLLPQMSYYAHSALQWWRERHTPLNFIIPSGNLGNALACLWARKMGLPIGDVHLACNANTTIPDFFAGNPYRPRQAIATLANAMDVGAPSNFERLRWTYPDPDNLRTILSAASVDDLTIKQTIVEQYQKYGEIFCPHTATAIRLLSQIRTQGDRRAWAIAATAHPAKFETILEPLLGHSLPIPAALSVLLQRPAHSTPLAADEQALKHWLIPTQQVT